MNLAGCIKKSDSLLEGLIKKYSEHFVTSVPAEIPELEKYLDTIKSEFSSVDEMNSRVKEVHYFVRKTKSVKHKVVVVTFDSMERYFVLKDDTSVSSCIPPLLDEELAVQLRVFEYNYTD
jgi:hypothetical protein